MMDNIERDVLDWFGNAFEWMEDMRLETRAAMNVCFPPPARLFEVSEGRGEDVMFVAWHYIQALKIRSLALEQGDFQWYVAATWALTQNWGKVQESIPWMHWGATALEGDPQLQVLVILTGAFQPWPVANATTQLAPIAPGEQRELIDRGISVNLVREDDQGRLHLGARAPRPTRN